MMMGPTALHFLGDLCSGLGMIGVVGVIVSFMKHHDMTFTIVCVVLGIVGFALMAVLQKQAKKSAEAKCLKALAQQKGRKDGLWEVVLTGCDAASKIKVIKVVREITGLGLAEAKAAVDGTPKTLKEAVSKDEAEKLKKKIEEAGGKVELK